MPAAEILADQVSYEDLYARWEKGNWSATAIDFTTDREQWHGTFGDLERRAALWNYSLFLHGEDSVADNLSPFIDAAPREEQKYFLATQQVDEARHAVFFGRFMQDVVRTGPKMADSLAATEPELTWGFRKVFDRLDRMADELRKDRSKPKLAAAVTLYHFVIEASLAQPGQHFIEDYLVEREVLPGFRAGMRNVALDEQRHIAFGVKLLADLNREDPEVKFAVAEVLREVTPWATAVFVPPGWDERYVTCFGATIEEVFASGASSLEQKLRAAGLPPEDLPGGVPIPTDLSDDERARRGVAMLRGRYLGESGPVDRDPELLATYFDSIMRAVDPAGVPDEPLTIQWAFKDAEPWHLRIDNGSTAVAPGLRPDADITVVSTLDDLVDVTAGRADPRLLLLRGRLRPKGRPGSLWRARKLFA
jgi:Ribonucleotide reductase, small chain/Alkyl sulfatase C-terminal